MPRARHFVSDVLLQAGCPDALVDRAALLVSELATSSVLHASDDFQIRVSIDEVVRIEVTDGLPSLPAAPDRSGEPKLSLYLLDAIADRWGWDPTDEGKLVWCELRHLP
ncbi:MAG: Regulatory protein [Actinomycetia bacterium]|nr:Regulatory protein [Actinomycetes bacterium]